MPQSQKLLSLPPNGVSHFNELEKYSFPEWFSGSDPEGMRLGSGGGTVHLLAEAWRASGDGASFSEWLTSSPKICIHGGGLSRRLPAYASAGKSMLPMPVWRWARGQCLDQTLLDLQLPMIEQIIDSAPDPLVAVASGDVLLRGTVDFSLPKADVVFLGLWVEPERASKHGVFFCENHSDRKLSFMLQKPTPEEIREVGKTHLFLVDTGLWFLSPRAVEVLFGKCGVNPASPDALPGKVDLYGDFGLALGDHPTVPDALVSELTCAVVPLTDGEFYHFGSCRDLIDSTLTLQNLVLDQRKIQGVENRPHASIFVQNAIIHSPLRSSNRDIWIENSVIAGGWRFSSQHVITGVPENEWSLALPAGSCLNIVPMKGEVSALHVYGFSDPFRGRLGDETTLFLGRPLKDWLQERELDFEMAGLDPEMDIHDAPLFPVLTAEKMTEGMVQWMLGDADLSSTETGEVLNTLVVAQCGFQTSRKAPKESDDARRDLWCSAPRVSARQLGDCADLRQLASQQTALRAYAIEKLVEHHWNSVFFRLDLRALAAEYNLGSLPFPTAVSADLSSIESSHYEMFRAQILRQRGDLEGSARHEELAFRALRDGIIENLSQVPVHPKRQLLEDQIAWGRAPVRLDLAGGWTDTPPYCLIHDGSSVVNLAVELNGQPPIQVFARPIDEPVFLLRSIDLGVEFQVEDRSDLANCAKVGGPFSLAKGALALAGFLPPFGGDAYASLRQQLESSGGGVELSFLAAVPKGSGLGTSSVLGAALLGTIADVFGLAWDKAEIVRRTLALEQMLTTGGGWQDQAGAVFGGVKKIMTQPGFRQEPIVNWLPEHLFRSAGNQILLYYTGITRVAKTILADIVRGMFLNEAKRLSVLSDIAATAEMAVDAIQRNDMAKVAEVVNRSRILNDRLDAGSYPPEVKRIMARIEEHTTAMKLLGAGGGGYLLIFAKDVLAAEQIRRILGDSPPNEGARFVDFSISENGFQVTRS